MAEFLYRDINSVDIDEEAIIKYAQGTLTPEQVFPENELEDWAKNNGYIKEEE